MHKMYLTIWKCAEKISDLFTLQKKSVFLTLSTFFWFMMGIMIYFIFKIAAGIQFSLVNMLITAGYAGVIMGFFGAVMYILRNTEPDELK